MNRSYAANDGRNTNSNNANYKSSSSSSRIVSKRCSENTFLNIDSPSQSAIAQLSLSTASVLIEDQTQTVFPPIQCHRCHHWDQLSLFNKLVCLCDCDQQPRHIPHYYTRHLHDPSHFTSMIVDNPSHLYNFISRCRKWVHVWRPRGRDLLDSSLFTVTSYNILAQNLLLNHLYLYQNQAKSDLAWHQRGERLRNELLQMNSDIYCLQEVHLDYFKQTILPFLADRGYEAIFKKKTGPTSQDGCSIIFKKNKFSLMDLREVEMDRTSTSPLLNREQVALVVKLKPLGISQHSSTESIIVANTHLLYNPNRGDVKLAQLRLLLAEIDRFKASTSTNLSQSTNHIILCGDMNSEPCSPLINFLKHGEINIRGLRSGDISGK